MLDIEALDNISSLDIYVFVNEKTPREYFEFLRLYLRKTPILDGLLTSFYFDVYDLPSDIGFLPSPIPEVVKLYESTRPRMPKRKPGLLGRLPKNKKVAKPNSIQVWVFPSLSDDESGEIVFHFEIYVPDSRRYDTHGTYMPFEDYLSVTGEYNPDLLAELEKELRPKDIHQMLNVLAFERVKIWGYGNTFRFSGDPPKNKSARK